MSVFGSGTRPWKRQTETKRAADSSVPGKGELVVSDAGKVYAGDGATQAKDLSPMLRKTDADTSYLDIRDYGAVGDDTTNNATAIQAALNAAAGRPVYVPPGRFRIGSTLTMNAGQVLIGSTGTGFGDGTMPAGASISTIVALASMNAPLISGPVGVGHVRIRDLHLDGNKNSNTSTTGISIADNTGVGEEAQWIIENVFIEACAVSALYVGTGRRAVKVSRLWAMYSGGVGITIKGSDSGFDSCIVGGSGSSGIEVFAPVTRILNADVFGSGDTGIVIGDGINMVNVSGCGIDKNNSHGIYLGSGSFNNVITGCLFHSNSAGADWSAHHIFLQGDRAAAASIIGNQFGGDSGYPNLAGWCIFINGNATIAAYGNILDPGTVHSGLLSAPGQVTALSQGVTTLSAAATLGGNGGVTLLAASAVATLPTAVGNSGRYTLKNIDTAAKTISTTSSQTIDGDTTLTLAPNAAVDIVSDGENWRTF